MFFPMSTPSLSINEIINHFGNQSILARKLGIRPQSVQEWVSTNHLPIRRAIEIERITEGRIRLKDILHLTGLEPKETGKISRDNPCGARA